VHHSHFIILSLCTYDLYIVIQLI